MELGRVLPEPAPPADVFGGTGRDELPEAGAVPEGAEMCELVDDDRLERLRPGEDEAPRERQPAGPARAPPPAALIADRDRGRRDAERDGMAGDRPVDRDPRAGTEPSLEDVRQPICVPGHEADVELVSRVPTDACDRRAPCTCHDGDESDPVRLTQVRDGRAVADVAAGGRGFPGHVHRREVATDPALAVTRERRDSREDARVRVPSHRDRDDEPATHVDGEAEPPCPRAAAEDRVDRSAGEVEPHRLLVGSRPASSPFARRHDRHRSRPGRTPVAAP